MTKYLQSKFDLQSENTVDLLDEVPLWSAPFGLKLLDVIQIKKNIKVLDIGFGLGFPLTELASRLGSTSKVYGIDPWEQAIKRAQRKIAMYGLKNVELICGISEEMPFNDNYFDIIASNNGINNVSDLDTTLFECHRVLKRGGQFVQTVNLETTMMEFYLIFNKVLGELGLEQEIKKVEEHIYQKRKPLNVLIDMLEDHGFDIENIVHDKFEYRFVDGTTMLNHYFIGLAFLDSWRGVLPPAKQTEVFRMVEERINQKAEKDGLFRLSIPFVVIDAYKV